MMGDERREKAIAIIADIRRDLVKMHRHFKDDPVAQELFSTMTDAILEEDHVLFEMCEEIGERLGRRIDPMYEDIIGMLFASTLLVRKNADPVARCEKLCETIIPGQARSLAGAICRSFKD